MKKECSKFVRCTINMQKSIIFLYSANEKSENEIKNRTHL